SLMPTLAAQPPVNDLRSVGG
nr:HM 23=23 kda type IV collagen-binding protein [Hypsizygus marmoreus=mushroom, Peptide Partial, 20 aa] [Hypsizygus marmoreus]